MRLLAVYMCLLALNLTSPQGWAKSIDPEVLFSNPNILTLEMSPDSRQIAGHLLDGGEYLGVFNHKTGIFSGLINFDKKYLKLSDYGWVDNDTLHFHYRDTRINRSSHGFVDLDFVDGELSFEVRYVAQHGYVVNYLPESEGELLFAYQSDRNTNSQKLYRLTVDELVAKDFGRKNRFRKEIDDAFYYVWDASSETLVALTGTDGVVEIWALYPGARKWRSIYQVESPEEEFLPVSIIDSSRMLVLSNKVTDTVALVEYNLDSKNFGEIFYKHERYDLVSADIAVNSAKEDAGKSRSYVRSVAYFDHGRLSVRYFLDEEVRLNQLLSAAFPGKQVAVVSEGLESDKKVLFVSSSADPGAYYLYDSRTKEAALIGERFRKIHHTLLSDAKVMTSTMADGTIVESVLTEPRAHSNNTLLVMPHGGPVGVRDYAHFNPEVQYFASRGFTILQVNFRGSSGFGKKFVASGRGEWGKAIEQDISAVVNEVRAANDFRNVCAIGSSYGGYSAMMLAIEHPGVYDCAVAMYGVFDLPLLFNSSNVHMHSDYLKGVERVVGKFDQSMKARSPFRLVDRISVPVLLLSGKKDRISGFEQSNRMKYMLEKSGRDVEFVAYDDVGHGHHLWTGERHQAALINEFLVRKLGLPEQDFIENTVRADEAVMIADSFWFGSMVAEDPSRAVPHYTRAAALGSGKAMYMLGQYFRRPDSPMDLEVAETWYQGAVEQDYAPAPYWLARFLEAGVFGEVSDAKVLQYYSRAEELGYEYAGLDVARLNCLGGESFTQNSQKCLELLASAGKGSDSGQHADAALPDNVERHKMHVLAQIVTSPRFNSASAGVVRKVLEEDYDVDTHRLSVELADFGSIAARKSTNKIFIGSTDDRIDLREVSHFGIEVEVEDQTGKSEKSNKAAMVVRWRFPEIVNKHGDPMTESSQLVFPALGDETIYYRSVVEEWERIPGKWAIDLLSIDGTVLASKQFTVVDSGTD